MQPPIVNVRPDSEWVPRLRRGNIVYAPRESEYLMVDFAYEPPDIGHYITGRIGLRYLWFSEEEWGAHQGCHSWHIKPNGCGFDNDYILLPCEGQCNDAPPPLPEPWVRQVERRIASLCARVDQLETAGDSWLDRPPCCDDYLDT